MNQVIEVVKVEHHFWPTCPCDVCALERKRRERPSRRDPAVKSMSVDAAALFGYLPRRNPHGSFARQLMHEG